MSFVKKVIGPDETLIGITSAHWIYGAKGLLWLTGLMIIGLALDYYASGLFGQLFRNGNSFAANRIGDILFWLPTALGFALFVSYLLVMIAPEIALTSKRIIFKKGIIAVDVKELDLEEIKAVDVDNGALGRFLNYGYIIFDARFVGNLDLPAIGKPYRFVKALNEVRSGGKQDMQMVDKSAQSSQAQTGQAGIPAEPPKLTSPRYEDPTDTGPRTAMGQVIHEVSENAHRALNPDLPPETGKKIRKPMVFNTAVVERAKRLRKRFKDNFAARAGKSVRDAQ